MEDFYFNGDKLAFGTASLRFSKNVDAINLWKKLVAEDRSATREEQLILANYVGWGDSRLLNSFHKIELELTPSQVAQVRASSLNAHYTSLPVVSAIWNGVTRLIQNHPNRKLRVIDPSAGIGHFKSMTPVEWRDRLEWTEIELDEITAGILGKLHPGSRVMNVGFEKADLPDKMFDLAISNVPFGNYGVFSRREMPKIAKRSIHDFFFANTYHLLKPGGILVYITSRFTMDKKEKTFRTWLGQRFHLLSAVRLPDTAFTENANTEVVTDVLFLRKLDEISKEYPGWIEIEEVGMQDTWRKALINRYYATNPEMIMGESSFSGTMYQSDGYTVSLKEGVDLAEMMNKTYARMNPIVYNSGTVQDEVKVSNDVVIIKQEKQSPVTTALMEIYKAAKDVLKAEQLADGTLGVRRQHLNMVYDKFKKKYGTIAANIKNVRGAEALFLSALESNGKKADIFSRSTVRVASVVQNPSISDILLMSLDTYGKVDLSFMASKAGKAEAEVVADLADSIFLDPSDNLWKTADDYLSGNVREKLRMAKAAAEYSSQFSANVKALEAVIPATIPAGMIRAPFGANWIPEKYIVDFLEHLFNENGWTVKYVPSLAMWTVSCQRTYYIARSLYTITWGTSRINAFELIEHALNSKTPQVWDGTKEDRVINTKETVAAQEKMLAIKAEFEKWLWEDADRAEDLVHIYNETYNAIRNIAYNGSHLSTPGLSQEVSLRSNQLDSAWRVIQNKSTLIAHEVGMGKTLSAIVAAMESKRLGFTKKAMIVVPNHTLSNWQSALQTAYPGANLLFPSPSDLSKGNRSKFMSNVAMNNWDIVLVPFSSFKLLPCSTERIADFYEKQKAELMDALSETKDERNYHTTKEIEKALKRLQVKMENLQNFKKDDEDAITFEELGIDMLIVDEFHGFKNLYFMTKMTRIAGLSNSDSQRAFDMFMKFNWIMEIGGKVVGMTGTPITNTIAEAYTMQRFFQLDELKKMGIDQFDAWVRQFAMAEPGLEMTPDGAGFRMNNRFRKFVNVPELMQMWLRVADMRRIDPASEEIKRPDLFRGKPVKVVSSGGADLQNYVMDLASRAEKVRAGTVEPTEDNMLLITSDGRKAALDMSLVVPAEPGSVMPKIDEMVRIVKQVWSLTEPVNGVQLIFCDLGVPKARPDKVKEEKDESSNDVVDDETEAEKFLTVNVYKEIKFRLVKAGVAEHEIAFIHSATTPTQKAKLFEQVNDGQIRVLIGSNEKMGTGINVQERCIATHHITPPWRPGDIEQQLGRMLRQGNRWTQVFQFVHVTEKSFDGYTWQLLENKAGFIAQINHGAVADREMDDVGDSVLTFTEIKGLASGNPKVMQKIVMDADMFRLKAIYQSWQSSLHSIRQDIKYKSMLIQDEGKELEEYKKAIVERDANTGKEFSIQLKEVFGTGELHLVTDKAKASKGIEMLAVQAAKKVMTSAVDAVMIGVYRGHNIYATAIGLDGAIGGTNEMEAKSIYLNFGGYKAYIHGEPIASMDATLRLLESKVEKLEGKISSYKQGIKRAEEELNKPWEHAKRYEELSRQIEELDKELQGVHEGGEINVSDHIGVPDVLAKVHDVEDALAEIDKMMKDPEVLARFIMGGSEMIPADEVAVDVLDKEISRLQAEREFTAILSAKASAIPVEKPKKKDTAENWRPEIDQDLSKAVQMKLFG